MTGKDDGASERERTPHTPRSGTASPSELAGFGLQLVLSVLLFLFAGRWLDARFHTAPLLLIVGMFVGGAAAFYSLFRKLGRGGRGGTR